MPRYRVTLTRVCVNHQRITVEIEAPSSVGAAALARATSNHQDEPYRALWADAREEPANTSGPIPSKVVEINQATEAAEAALRG